VNRDPTELSSSSGLPLPLAAIERERFDWPHAAHCFKQQRIRWCWRRRRCGTSTCTAALAVDRDMQCDSSSWLARRPVMITGAVRHKLKH
jgi:hypothetical protein